VIITSKCCFLFSTIRTFPYLGLWIYLQPLICVCDSYSINSLITEEKVEEHNHWTQWWWPQRHIDCTVYWVLSTNSAIRIIKAGLFKTVPGCNQWRDQLQLDVGYYILLITGCTYQRIDSSLECNQQAVYFECSAYFILSKLITFRHILFDYLFILIFIYNSIYLFIYIIKRNVCKGSNK